MKIHEHLTCKFKYIMGSAQSKPTSTHHFNIVMTHLKCKCDAMHDHLKTFKQNPTQKFHKNFINFGKTPKFFKNPKS